jgi:hypothetical protein
VADPLKERIEVQFKANLEADQTTWLQDEVDAGRLTAAEKALIGVYRWDMRPRWVDPQGDEKHQLRHLDVLMLVGTSSPEEGSQGNIGYTRKVLPVAAYVVIRLAENDTENTSTVYNRWIALLETSLMQDPRLIEDGSGERLLHDVRFAGATAPPIEDNQREVTAAVRVDAVFQHPRNDPYTLA